MLGFFCVTLKLLHVLTKIRKFKVKADPHNWKFLPSWEIKSISRSK